MVEPYKRSRTLRRLQVKLPGGRTVWHYEERKPKNAKCGKCGSALKGIQRERPCKMMNMARTMKTVQRPYGGNLCSRCMRDLIIGRARAQ